MNTTPRRRVKRHTPESLRRKSLLKAAGWTYDELAARAGVKWRMVKFWMDDEKTSANVAGAFDELLREHKQDGPRKRVNASAALTIPTR